MAFNFQQVRRFLSAAKRAHWQLTAGPSVTLGDVAHGRNNNLDLLRLLFAALVLVGHSFSIAMAPASSIPGSSFLRSIWIGSVGVAGFFAISGFLVTGSAMNHGLLGFLKSRILRIYPGLIVCLLVTILVMGFYSRLSFGAYLTHPETKKFLTSNVAMVGPTANLPGVFDVDLHPRVQNNINGSLCTLPVELRLYVVVFALAVFGIFKSRPIATAAIGTIIFSSYHSFGDIPMMIPGEGWRSISFYFAIGAFIYLYRESVVLDWRVALFCVWVFLWAQGKSYFQGVAPLPFVYAVLYFGYRTPVLPIGRWIGDLSYGLYIYAWPIQRIISYHFPILNPWIHSLLTFVLTMAVAALSWHFVEKPALALKNWKWRRKATASASTTRSSEVPSVPLPVSSEA